MFVVSHPRVAAEQANFAKLVTHRCGGCGDAVRARRHAQNGLFFVIATSGMIKPELLVVQGQFVMGDSKKYLEFVGNVVVIDIY